MTEQLKSYLNKKRMPLKLNLQHFAEPAAETPADPKPGDSGAGKTDEPLTLTQEELEKRIEAESDRKLNSALDKQKSKLEKDMKAEVERQLNEHKRLSELSDDERKAETLTQREQELIDRENRIKLSEIKSDAINELSTRKVDTRFADYLITDDVDTTHANIKAFNKLLDETINEAVKASTRQAPPSAGGYKLNDKTADKSVVELAREKRIIK